MLEFLKKITREAGDIAKSHYKAGIAHKHKSSRSDVVTVADMEVEMHIRKQINKNYPKHGIIGEEFGDENVDAEFVWVIDPIDGTRNYANHISFWCTMVGVEKNGEPYMGAIYDAIQDELFYAQVGCGAYMNEEKITVNDHDRIEDSFLVYSGGSLHKNSPYYPDNFEGYKRFRENLFGDMGFWTMSFGSMLIAGHLAAGRIDAQVINSGLYHDYLAASVIVTEAGGKFTDSDGSVWKKGRKDIVLANPKLHKKLLELFK